MTFHELIEGYLESMIEYEDLPTGEQRVTAIKPSYRAYRRLVDRYFTTWHDMPTFPQIYYWHKKLKAKPHQANKALAFLRALFTWASRWGYWQGPNPATGVQQHPTFARETFMEEHEIARLVAVLPRLNRKTAALLVVLLTTGCRLSEALRMQPAHLDFATGKWFQPKTKSGRPHTTYLCMQARAALALLPQDGFLFAGESGGWTVGGAEFAWNKVRQQPEVDLSHIRLHDFRRTVSTYLRRQHDLDFVKRCINHVNEDVTSIYVRFTQAEVAAALQAQADRWLGDHFPFAIDTHEPFLERIELGTDHCLTRANGLGNFLGGL